MCLPDCPVLLWWAADVCPIPPLPLTAPSPPLAVCPASPWVSGLPPPAATDCLVSPCRQYCDSPPVTPPHVTVTAAPPAAIIQVIKQETTAARQPLRVDTTPQQGQYFVFLLIHMVHRQNGSVCFKMGLFELTRCAHSELCRLTGTCLFQ